MIVTRILSIDIGLRNTGWVVVKESHQKVKIEDFGCIKTKPNKKKKVSLDNMDNVRYITRELMYIIEKSKPSYIVAELPTSGAKSAKAIVAMALSSAIIACIVEILEIDVVWVSPMKSKQDFIGQRSGDKDLAMAKTRELYPDVVWPKYKNVFEHVADAVSAYYSAKVSNLI